MVSYSLNKTINNISGGICNSPIVSTLMRSPIVAGMIVTIIALIILQYSKNKNLTRIFVLASLANISYLFFHSYALSTYLKNNSIDGKLMTEFDGIHAVEGGEDENFQPVIA